MDLVVTNMENDKNMQKDFLNLFRKEANDELPVAAPSPYADYYKMDHPNRGLVVIFNNVNFSIADCPKRKGSNKDRDDLITAFHELNFNVVDHNDLTAYELLGVLQTVSKMDHTRSDCLVIVVMSHGENGRLYARDTHYATSRLWRFFSASNCPTLAGKPKLFFIQACRGTGLHAKQILRYNTNEEDSKTEDAFYSIPVMADILIMYSTMEGYYSFRDPALGSYFIQSLVQQLKQQYRKHDLLTILTFVNRQVAIDFTSESPDFPEFSNHKQMCSIVSMLTRLVVFKI